MSGLKLVQELATLRNLPRLVVLISCQSAGDGAAPVPRPDRGTLSAIGPRLAEAGVPAVLAMQGDLQMPTAREFLPPFFKALQETGQVDEAVTRGRAAVRLAADGWVPVLYTRLVEGRVWFTRGLKGGDGFSAWQQLAYDINRGRCVPILGSGVLEPFIGTTREVANRLAAASGFPLALCGREDLPQVAQFLQTMRDRGSPQVQIPVVSEMAEAVRQRYPALGLGPVSRIDPGNDLRERLTAAWRVYQEGRPYEPHRYLAGMRQIKTIITTNPDDLLKEAMTAAGRAPRVRHCRWDGEADDSPAGDPPPDPVGDGPEIFQLMGHLSNLESLYVTEDDYFRFLTAVTRRQSQKKDPGRDDDMTDDRLRGALASSALLFLGFRIVDWDFRTLCRVLLDQKGANARRARTHIAVQFDPEDGTHGDAVKARVFIEKLFQELLGGPTSSQVVVYWGSAENFLEDLDEQWTQLQPTPALATAKR